MSHVASFLYLNALFEASFFHAEHLTASEKYKFSRQKDIIREFCKAKLVSKSLICDAGTQALRHKMLSEVSDTFTAFNEVLELAEIVAVLRTAYRVFFENSQMFGAERWNAWKFVVSRRRNAGTSGNLFTAFDKALEPAEIRCQRSTRHWSEQKFVLRKRQNAGTRGNSLSASDRTLEPAEICLQRSTGYWNEWKCVHGKRRGAGTGGNCRSAMHCLRRKSKICLPSFPTENSRGELEKRKKIAVVIRFTSNRRRGRREK